MYKRLSSIIENRYLLFGITILSPVLALLAWWYPGDVEYSSLKMALVANVQPINIDGNIRRDTLRITYNDRDVTNLTYLKIKIQNDGTKPLTITDFIEPVRIHLPSGSEIFDFSVSEDGLLQANREEQNILVLHSELLNPGDIADVRVLLDTPKSQIDFADIKVTGRVVGVSSLNLSQAEESEFLNPDDEKRLARRTLLNAILAIFILGLLAAAFIALMLLMNYKGNNLYIKFLSVGAMGLWVTIFLGSTLYFVAYFLFQAIVTIYTAFF